MPAQQRLEADRPVPPEIDLGLVFEAQLALPDRLAEIARQIVTKVERALDRAGEPMHADAGRPGVSGGGSGVLQQLRGAVAVRREHDDAEARPRLQGMAVDLKAAIEGGRDLARDHVGADLCRQIGQDQGEPVALDPGDRVAGAQLRAEARGDRLQQPAAAILAQRVAVLQPIQVDPDQRQQAVGPAALRQRLGQAVVQQQAVGQTGRQVVAGEVRHGSLPRICLATWRGGAAGMAMRMVPWLSLMPG